MNREIGKIYFLILAIWAWMALPLGAAMVMYSQGDYWFFGGKQFSTDERMFFVAFLCGGALIFVVVRGLGRLLFRP
ncbi:MAG TPA: hypothetical protein VGE65_01230 [Sphingobium sp.]